MRNKKKKHKKTLAGQQKRKARFFRTGIEKRFSPEKGIKKVFLEFEKLKLFSGTGI